MRCDRRPEHSLMNYCSLCTFCPLIKNLFFICVSSTKQKRESESTHVGRLLEFETTSGAPTLWIGTTTSDGAVKLTPEKARQAELVAWTVLSCKHWCCSESFLGLSLGEAQKTACVRGLVESLSATPGTTRDKNAQSTCTQIRLHVSVTVRVRGTARI